MRRRGFLQMLGGALVAPLMPHATLGAATKAAYPASALHAAIYHAQSDVSFSVFTLAKRLGLQPGQAEALMSDMSARGILGPLQGTTQAGRWARSKVWQRPFAQGAAAHKATTHQRSKPATTSKPQTNRGIKTTLTTDLDPLLTYLRKMAQDQGFALRPMAQSA